MSLSWKLRFVASLVLALLTIAGVIITQSSDEVRKDFIFIADEAAPELIVLGHLKVASGEVVEHAVTCALFQCASAQPVAQSTTAEHVKHGVEESIADLTRTITLYRSGLTHPMDAELAEQIDESSKALKWMARRLVERSADGSNITTTVERLSDLHHTFVTLVDQAIANEAAEFQKTRNAGSRRASQGIIVAIALIAGMTFLFFFLGVQLNDVVLRPLVRLRKAAEAMERGDLQTRVKLDATDELGAVAMAFDRMAASLQQQTEERLRIEQDLREREATFSLLAENAQDMIVQYDHKPAPRFAYVSPSATRITGYTPEEYYADPYLGAKITYAEDLPMFMELVQSPEKFSGTIEVRWIHKNGDVVWLEMRNVLIFDDSSELTSVIGITRDITERKLAEVELRRQKDAAETATRVKAEFLANMSHEIRTPLNAVIGMTSLLLDMPLVGEQRDFIETIRTSGDSLLTVINDILDFSKIEARKLELENHPFDIHQCIEDALDLTVVKATEKRLELAYQVEPDVPSMVVGDITRLRQILVNLLGNAVKFTEAGEVVVTVKSRPLSDDEVFAVPYDASPAPWHELHFTVRDSGIGIRPEQMSRLFRSFSQVDASTTRKYGGTGLGLAISQQLSEIMGGRMWVESDGIPGHGSAFHFTIQAQAHEGQLPRYTALDHAALQGKRVLLVDDNAINRLILTRQLEAWDMLPISAASGVEALSWIQRGDTFDLAILDMCMPEMDGLMLASHIRRHRHTAHMPLIMLSSLECSLIEADAKALQFVAVIAKPVKQARLHSLLVEVVTNRVSQPQPVLSSSTFDITLADRLPLNILLVEDNLVNQKVAQHMLARLGYRTDVAANGVEALRALERQPYDVILMDVQMPEMDGMEATRLICERWPVEQRPHIIAMTAHALSGDADKCLAAGMSDYISKPVQADKLVAALQQSQNSTSPACRNTIVGETSKV